MPNGAIRKHAFSVVRQNIWKIVLVSILLAIISSLIGNLPFLTANYDLSQMLYRIEELAMQENFNAIFQIYASVFNPFLIVLIQGIVFPLLSVGVTYWMTLHMADRGDYSINEWFATFGRNTKAAFTNVIFYQIVAGVVSFVLTLLWLIVVGIIVGFTIIVPIVTAINEGQFNLSGWPIALIIILALLTLFVTFLIGMVGQVYFTFPNFIVYDIGGISFKDVWRVNRKLVQGKFWKATRLHLWFFLVYFVLAIALFLILLLIFLLIGGLFTSTGQDSFFAMGAATVIGIIFMLIVFWIFTILYFVALDTAWASFYRETMKEKIDSLEAAFPHINFRPLTALGIKQSAQLPQAHSH